MVFHGPNRSGRSRHGKPVFAMKTTAFKKCRFDNSAGRPGRSRSGGSRCLIRTQSTAVSSCRRITTVDHETIFPSIPQRQAITVLRDFPANPTSGCPSLRTRPSLKWSEIDGEAPEDRWADEGDAEQADAAGSCLVQADA